MNARLSRVYVVRIWLEPTQGGEGVWRASVTETRTQERRYFTNPEELKQFLERLFRCAKAARSKRPHPIHPSPAK
ncbi:hypothetical protein Mesil_2960 [Allomeiothermus silvanus DSM 9946]|uniref:Uncharacterized protein n=1 Tax=Allomeiothermus silvanus (strain ATCC 700542 / DSM 9946 / NBRC 106475 / NCIMB 13440 / VI-R2) TaxID=526227 RepID=D7BDH9_ALLS1|nr:hypothetical protein [Allomeiothermus silvanus]ADH64799.1 hypothetical protein Mesil_2960 [Allomeiothermus silvanus DSM 9946]